MDINNIGAHGSHFHNNSDDPHPALKDFEDKITTIGEYFNDSPIIDTVTPQNILIYQKAWDQSVLDAKKEAGSNPKILNYINAVDEKMTAGFKAYTDFFGSQGGTREEAKDKAVNLAAEAAEITKPN
ncbi:MAG: hypothetical protein ACOYK9_03025 [Chlamydiia bacterium]